MPGDPTVLQGVPAALFANNLLNTVAVKLPPFWPGNIETWFVQSKSQFRLKAVTVSQTKFDYCVQAMSQEVPVKVLDLTRRIPFNISRIDCYRCLHSMTMHALRPLQTCL